MGICSSASTKSRLRLGGGVIAFYSLLTVVVFGPLASDVLPETGAQDLANHVSGIVEARNALVEGQFPIRVAPHQNDGERYPIFQFYGNLSYTTGGLLYLAGVNPYLAWKIVVGSALVLGGFYVFRCSRLQLRFWPSLVAGAVFITAPYTLCDLHGRQAYSEIISIGLLPVVFFYLLRLFTAPSLWTTLVSGVCWSCLALTHAVTFLLGSLFFALYVLSYFEPRREYFRRLLAAGGAYGMGLGLSAWYIGPQLWLLPDLAGGLAFPLWNCSWLTPLGVLLAPAVVPPVHVPTMLIHSPAHFGLQVGWPILAAVALAAHGWWRREPELGHRRPAVKRLLAFFGLTFFLAWTPFDFWRFLPRIVEFVQFPYRLLMFIVLWGSLLSAHALQDFFKGQMHFRHVVVCVLLLGVCMSPYLKPHHSPQPLSLEAEIARPNMGRGGANGVYRLALGALHESMRSRPAAHGYAASLLQTGEATLAVRPGHPTRITVDTPLPRFVQLPVAFYPEMLDVRIDGQRVAYGNYGCFVAQEMSAGRHEVSVRFIGLRWANNLSLATWTCVAAAVFWLLLRRLGRLRLAAGSRLSADRASTPSPAAAA